tara:strand:- start:74 stop:1012 length:939 start_codon:yes stop_codon:yes gene_type:complete
MKVLIVCSGTNVEQTFEHNHEFVYEQIQELKKRKILFDIFLIRKKGILGYLKTRKRLLEKLKFGTYDLIHAHHGYSGMLAALQLKCPVIITFIGCDINLFQSRLLSNVAILLSKYNIFVSNELKNKTISKKGKSYVLPYGLDLTRIYPINMYKAREELGLDANKNYCLFGSKKNRIEKNYALAKKAVSLCDNTELIHLTGNYTREEVNLMINASNCILLTSLREGSPQIIKEAMACNRPIISTDVGDVKKIIGNLDGCHITSFNAIEIAEKLDKVINDGDVKIFGRDRIKHLGLDSASTGEKLFDIYKKIVN